MPPIQETLSADHVVRPYSGAVCQYVLTRGETGSDVGAGAPQVIDVTFSWFETGSLDRERAAGHRARRDDHRNGRRTAQGVPGAA